MDDTGQGQDPSAFPTNTTGNGSKQPSPEEEQISAIGPITVEPSAQQSVGKFTGPRSPEGKERSKHNALSHGIFSEVTVLPGESSDEYVSLLKGLSGALKPKERLEKLLVEKLATLAWRHRRLLLAEGAEIQQASEFLEWDQKMQQQHEAELAKRTLIRTHKTFADRPGLIPEMQNPEILEYCVELLLGLQRRIKSLGFVQEEYDRSILQTIYGAVSNLHGTLLNSYYGWLKISRVSEEERQRTGSPTPEQCKDALVSQIDAEIRRFRDYRQEQAEKESERTKLEILRRKVPESEKLDRLLRYETSLERAFDRTLTQLERAQRMRKGQPLLPQLEVKHS
jgi:hypothetical protein